MLPSVSVPWVGCLGEVYSESFAATSVFDLGMGGLGVSDGRCVLLKRLDFEGEELCLSCSENLTALESLLLISLLPEGLGCMGHSEVYKKVVSFREESEILTACSKMHGDPCDAFSLSGLKSRL